MQGGLGAPSQQFAKVFPLEAILLVTKLAIHRDGALFLQNILYFGAVQGRQGIQGPISLTAACEADRTGIEQAHRLLVIQAEQQLVRR